MSILLCYLCYDHYLFSYCLDYCYENYSFHFFILSFDNNSLNLLILMIDYHLVLVFMVNYFIIYIII